MTSQPYSWNAIPQVPPSARYPSLRRISPEMYGAKHDNTTDDTSAINAAIAACITYGAALYFLAGISYYVNGNVDISGGSGQPLLVIGDGMEQSSIRIGTAGSFTVAANATVQNLTFRDWKIVGNAAANAFGLKLGSSGTKIVNNFVADRWRCTGFNGTNGKGIFAQCAQDLEFNNCWVTNNYDNLFRPNDATSAIGYLTTLRITGDATNFDVATRNAIRLEGQCQFLRLLGGTFRSCGDGAVYVGVPIVTSDANAISMRDIYLENNNIGNSAVADIYISGNSGSSQLTEALIDSVYLGTPANAFSDAQLSMDYAAAVVNNCLGLTSIKTTTNTEASFKDNDLCGQGSALRNVYESLLGIIYAKDQPYDTNTGPYTVATGITVILSGLTASPSSGAWKEGAWIPNRTPVASGGKILLGWSRQTTGSNNILGTDWQPFYGTTS